MGERRGRTVVVTAARLDGQMQLIDMLSGPVRSSACVVRLPPGSAIVREGDIGNAAFVLLSGLCEVRVHGDVVNLVRPGELFGEIACLEGGIRTATVITRQSSEVLELPKETLRAELLRSPALLDRFLQALAFRVRDVSRRETTIRDEQRQLRRVLEGLQPSLAPFAQHPVISVGARWQPATLASGDYYDVLELAPERYLFALGDVMGHGAPTAPTVGMVRGQLHEAASASCRPSALLTQLHQHLRRHGHPNVFMTLTLLVLDLESSTATFGVAGPPSPLLYRDGRCTALTTRLGWTLGYPFEGGAYADETTSLAAGDTLFFYTDGLSDAPRSSDIDGDRLGTAALGQLLSQSVAPDAATTVDRVFAAVAQYQAGCPFDDDATALIVTLKDGRR